MVEAFAKCPMNGCTVNVWGLVRSENYCRNHGGNRLSFPEVSEDEWGEPTTSTAAAGSPPVGGPPLPEDA